MSDMSKHKSGRSLLRLNSWHRGKARSLRRRPLGLCKGALWRFLIPCFDSEEKERALVEYRKRGLLKDLVAMNVGQLVIVAVTRPV